ncbi:GNAT family N-acetyltransferase [uncultured Prevotella sp.]|uniref:GNAT family N-acetyltransferase n=1 Tax=uncultured Prevotella sp. TaxID=159272 RepID=UPI002803ADE7|nr:GNAT family N-acetyltransferase [uncultured Prevotella sp.]
MFEIRKYDIADRQEWDSFIGKSKNGTFLFKRGYMEYHNDRFEDYSLLVYDNKKLRAVLPANVKDDILQSHGGLTYGGLISDGCMTTETAMEVFSEINKYLLEQGIEKVVYKPTPWIYHTLPAEEDLYAIIQVCGAKLISREISSTVYLPNRPNFSQLRRRCVNKARRNGIIVRESNDIATFWNILNANLEGRYGVSPVHTEKELSLLASRFPDSIKLFMAYDGEEALGGTLVFVMNEIVHTQYIAASPKGKTVGALDMVFDELINEEFSNYRFLDFGKSTEQHGIWLNKNLIHQKEGFGGRGVCYDVYEWNVK